jgi:hypothetical protein
VTARSLSGSAVAAMAGGLWGRKQREQGGRGDEAQRVLTDAGWVNGAGRGRDAAGEGSRRAEQCGRARAGVARGRAASASVRGPDGWGPLSVTQSK